MTEISDADDVDQLVNIGFPFKYNGTDYTEMHISSNGTITFNRSYDDYEHEFGKRNNLDLIAPFWTDLKSWNQNDPYSSVKYLLEGSGINHTVTIQWDRIHACCSFTNNEVVSFQVKLYERNGKIEFRYKKNPTYGGRSFPEIASVGFQFIESNSFLSVNELSRDATITSTIAYDQVSWINEDNDGLVLTFSINPIISHSRLHMPVA